MTEPFEGSSEVGGVDPGAGADVLAVPKRFAPASADPPTARGITVTGSVTRKEGE